MRQHRRQATAALVLGLMTLATAGALAQTTYPSFEGHRIEDWDTGDRWPFINDITPDGRYLLGTVELASGDSALGVWDAVTQSATTYPIAGYTCMTSGQRGGLSGDGRRIAGHCKGADGYWKAALIEDGALQILTGLPGETHLDASWSNAIDISADGTKVIGSVYILQGTNIDLYPFQWTAGGMVDLGRIENSGTNKPLRISDDGSTVVGWFQGSTGRVPAVWRGPGTGARVLAAGIVGEATAVNHDGTCIGGYANAYGNWLWKAGQGAQLLGGTPGTGGAAVAAISDDCTTVFMTAANPSFGAWVWTQGVGTRSFANYVASRGVPQSAINGWTFRKSSAMTPDAQVFAGSGFDMNDLPPAFITETHAYVVRFEPPSQAPCELDWNCDGVVDAEDWQDRNFSDGTYGGFYLDANLYVQYHATNPGLVEGGYYRKNYTLCNGAPGNLDWDGNGTINLQDAYKGSASPSTVNSFYTQIYVYLFYPGAYSYYYPTSTCTP